MTLDSSFNHNGFLSEHPTLYDKYVCEVQDKDKPMIFRGQPYCSEDCRKRLAQNEQ